MNQFGILQRRGQRRCHNSPRLFRLNFVRRLPLCYLPRLRRKYRLLFHLLQTILIIHRLMVRNLQSQIHIHRYPTIIPFSTNHSPRLTHLPTALPPLTFHPQLPYSPNPHPPSPPTSAPLPRTQPRHHPPNNPPRPRETKEQISKRGRATFSGPWTDSLLQRKR